MNKLKGEGAIKALPGLTKPDIIKATAAHCPDPGHREGTIMPGGRLFLLLFMFFFAGAGSASAQYQAPDTKLDPYYEEQRYGSSLWETPREPYKSDFDQYKARTYIPPEENSPAGLSSPNLKPGRKQRPIDTRPEDFRRSDATVKKRFQTEMKFKEDQRKISERSRMRPPSTSPRPVPHRVYGPGQSPALDK